MNDKMQEEFDLADEYVDAVGNVHAPFRLRNKVESMAYQKRRVSVKAKMHWMAAAATVIVLCLCFRSKIMAFVENVSYKSVYIIGRNNRTEFSGDMGYVHVNTLKWEDFQHKYNSIEELEELMGVRFLKSEDAYISPFPRIDLVCYEYYHNYNNSVTYRISDQWYYMNNMELDEVYESGALYHSTGDNAYKIIYEAEIHNDPGIQENDESSTSVQRYKWGVYVEKYVTAEGYDADIFIYKNEYNAVIFDHNIKYTFRADGLGCMDKLDVFKKFLDTLK